VSKTPKKDYEDAKRAVAETDPKSAANGYDAKKRALLAKHNRARKG
jgi:hypothetical protein